MDIAKLRADVEVLGNRAQIYSNSRHVERVVVLAQRLMESYPGDPQVVEAACLLQGMASEGSASAGLTSAIIANAYLRGLGVNDALIERICQAIQGADWSGDEEDGRPMTDEDLVVWHARRLDIVSVERHVDFLVQTPTRGRGNAGVSYQERDQHLFTYRNEYVMAALNLRGRLWLPGSTEIFDELYESLEAFLDNLAMVRIERLPVQLRYLIEGLPKSRKRLLPASWRRLREVTLVQDGVRRILSGEDPQAVRVTMPPPGLPYVEFRGRQRTLISTSHDIILQMAQQRILASQAVAAEKYLESDTLHKPEVEENLFVSARRRGKQLGLNPETAEDIARLLLSKAREVQERTMNQIALRLSRLHGEILDASSPETRLSESDIAIPSLVLRTGGQPLAREDELIKELRLTGLTDAYPGQNAEFLKWYDNPHHYLEKGLVVGSRDIDLFLQALFGNERCKVIANFTPTGPLHLGHGALVNLLAYYQQLGAEVVITFNDLDVLLQDISGYLRRVKPKTAPTKSLMEIADDSKTKSRGLVAEYFKQFAALGLDLDHDSFTQLSRNDVVDLALELGSQIPINVLNSALGLRMNDSSTDTFLPLVYIADILHQQAEKYGGPCRTLVLSGLERDVYVRMARNIAEKFGFQKPSALYLRMAKSLATYEEPATAAAVDVMTAAVPQGAIFYEDDADTIRRKIRHAYTGGRKTQEEQRRLGGNPDSRVCSVSSLLAFHGVTDPEEYRQIQTSCRAGTLLCGECKANATERIVEYITEQTERRQSQHSQVVGRA